MQTVKKREYSPEVKQKLEKFIEFAEAKGVIYTFWDSSDTGYLKAQEYVNSTAVKEALESENFSAIDKALYGLISKLEEVDFHPAKAVMFRGAIFNLRFSAFIHTLTGMTKNHPDDFFYYKVLDSDTTDTTFDDFDTGFKNYFGCSLSEFMFDLKDVISGFVVFNGGSFYMSPYGIMGLFKPFFDHTQWFSGKILPSFLSAYNSLSGLKIDLELSKVLKDYLKYQPSFPESARETLLNYFRPGVVEELSKDERVIAHAKRLLTNELKVGDEVVAVYNGAEVECIFGGLVLRGFPTAFVFLDVPGIPSRRSSAFLDNVTAKTVDAYDSGDLKLFSDIAMLGYTYVDLLGIRKRGEPALSPEYMFDCAEIAAKFDLSEEDVPSYIQRAINLAALSITEDIYFI